ncbi:MAG: triose-phosphate isomerase [Candidatus Hydrogenedens sp.]|nr:triose-phosphate isomerase [Candidatus Hydrogenedens sp.]
MRRPIIAGNWKMNLVPDEAEQLVLALIPLVRDARCDVVVCPPYTDLSAVGRLLSGTNVRLGAQNVHWAPKGAFTGEISAEMLHALGVEYAIIGHSERRQYFGETDETVNKRLKAALAASITPIVCVGETLEQRENGVTNTIVSKQTVAALAGVEAAEVPKIVIAYEPIWAIGTGRTATPRDANDTIAVVRSAVSGVYGGEIAERVRIQYGGSMNGGNGASLMEMPEIDGGLIGGASLKPQDFAAIVHH